MSACFSCHSLSESGKKYHIYYGAESFKPCAPGNYEEYNKKGISEQVVFDEVCICSNCIDKAEYNSMYKYAVKLWSAGARNPTGKKCCYRCRNISESRFCSHYKYAIPSWVKSFTNIEKIEPSLDLGPVKYTVYCKEWKPLSSIDSCSTGSLISQFRMGLYLATYYKQNRKKLKRFLFQDLFSCNNLIEEIQGFLNSNSNDNILGLSYYYLVYKPFRKYLKSNMHRIYCDKRTKIKDCAEALS